MAAGGERYRIEAGKGAVAQFQAFLDDIDLRLARAEGRYGVIDTAAREVADRAVRYVEGTLAPRAAELETLLDGYRAGVPADVVTETAARQFWTAARAAAVVAELRGGVAPEADTLAELYALVLLRALPSDISAAITGLVGGAPAGRQTLKAINDAVVANTATLAAITNGQDPTLDSFAEVLTRLIADEGQVSAVMTALGNRLRGDADGGYTAGVQDRFRANLGGAAPLTLSGTAAILTVLDTDRDVFGTGTFSITAANGGAGWRSGEIRNDNTVSGLGTLKVPAGATLDGVTDGTQILFPSQVARLRQTGATAYRVQWIVQRPVIRRYPGGTSVAYWDFPLPVGWQRFRFPISRAYPNANGGQLVGYLSFDGGATFKSGTNDYNIGYMQGAGTGTSGSTANSPFMSITGGIYTGAGDSLKASADLILDLGEGAERQHFISTSSYVNASPAQSALVYAGTCTANPSARPNVLRIGWGNGATQGQAQITMTGEA